MNDLWVIAFFPRTKTVDVLSSTAVQGDVVVGRMRKVTWNKVYNAKIVYAGPKAACEEKAPMVTVSGALDEPFFKVDSRPSSSTPYHSCDCCTVCKGETGRKLDEILALLKSIEVGTASKGYERDARRCLERIATQLEESNILLLLLLSSSSASVPLSSGVRYSGVMTPPLPIQR